MGKRRKIEDLCIQGLQELHEEGKEWVCTTDLAQRAAILDEPYVARRTAIANVLGFAGVHIPIIPDFPRPAAVYNAVDRLERKGAVQAQFEDGDHTRRLIYRLTPNEQLPETSDK